MPQVISKDYAGLSAAFAWGRRQTQPVVPLDVVIQDELTQDVIVPFPHGRYVVYGTT